MFSIMFVQFQIIRNKFLQKDFLHRILFKKYKEGITFITKDFEFFAMKLSNLSQQRNIIPIDIKRVNFYKIVDFSLNLIKNIWKIKNSKVLINKSIDQNICEYINTDEIRLKQIIINLLSALILFHL